IEKGQQRTHDIIVEFTTVEQKMPPLQGIVHNFGICEAIDEQTLQVRFTGGELAPKHADQLEQWQAVFGNQSRPEKRSLKERVVGSLANLWLGIVPPQGMDQQTGKVSFTMQRSPKGKLSLLYLDEELRITRGERGTVLVCERLSQ
ncbi:MAG TPA: PAP/fibrillin family protein, partial [Candidatus Obscuribacterales bacterium]